MSTEEADETEEAEHESDDFGDSVPEPTVAVSVTTEGRTLREGNFDPRVSDSEAGEQGSPRDAAASSCSSIFVSIP